LAPGTSAPAASLMVPMMRAVSTGPAARGQTNQRRYSQEQVLFMVVSLLIAAKSLSLLTYSVHPEAWLVNQAPACGHCGSSGLGNFTHANADDSPCLPGPPK